MSDPMDMPRCDLCNDRDSEQTSFAVTLRAHDISQSNPALFADRLCCGVNLGRHVAFWLLLIGLVLV